MSRATDGFSATTAMRIGGRIMLPTGGLWVAWPKKAAKVATDITENVIRAILVAAADPATGSAPFLRARYAHDPAPNPVLVRRSAWALAAGLDGDRGLGALLASRPDLVVSVEAPGDNPDIDTPADLAALARRGTPTAEARP